MPMIIDFVVYLICLVLLLCAGFMILMVRLRFMRLLLRVILGVLLAL